MNVAGDVRKNPQSSPTEGTDWKTTRLPCFSNIRT